jgi:hypothetical protein
MMPTILLDRNHDVVPPDGYLIIDSEVEFLDKAISGQSLFIRGQQLCDWAQIFYDGRKISYQEVVSLVNKLVETFTGLTTEQADYICNDIGKKTTPTGNITASFIMGACYPIPLWHIVPSKKHAAEWLLWLDDAEPNIAFQPILKAITNDWKQIDPALGELYNCIDAPSARIVLGKWLGAEINPFIDKFGQFPITPVPDKWIETLKKSWRKEIVKTDGKFHSEFLMLSLPWQFKQLVALATLEYFEKYPDSKFLTIELYDQISRFVSGNDRARLRIIKPVPVPSGMPESPDGILSWFATEYLPFREWQVATNAEKAYQQVLAIGLQFGMWYLDFYPKALTSKKYLSFFKSKNIKEQDSDHVNMLIILDGLHALDSRYVMAALLKSNSNQRLVMTENSFCFAPLPTVTDFAKGALVHGVQPTLMKEFDLLGEDVSEQQTPLPKLQVAQPGSLFIWRIQDPDRTYHTKNKSSMLKNDVEGELSTIAQKITEIVEKVAPTVPLRIIITTDHGRFLGISKRTVKIPEGMEAHGRAAWGKTKIIFDKTGYMIDGELVYISKDRFGLLSDDAAIILSDRAFQHDKYEQEICTHGGLFPEEVVIPWMVFERNIAKPDLELKFSGENQANQPGKLHISILNPSSLSVSISKIELDFGGDKKYSDNLLREVGGFGHPEFDIDLPSWPSSEQVVSGKSLIVIRLPSGEEYNMSPSLAEIKVSEFYTRDKSIFEGLDQ